MPLFLWLVLGLDETIWLAMNEGYEQDDIGRTVMMREDGHVPPSCYGYPLA